MLDPLLLLVGVGLVSIVCQLLAYRVKLPAILPLLLAGIILGPAVGLINPDKLLGELLFPIISLSVAIILFEGALTLKLDDISGHGKIVRRLCTTGALITWLVVAPTAHFALGISWELAFLFGAIVTVTGPTVVKPMLRSVRPTANVSRILQWEGIIIDPIGALLAVLVFEFIVSSQQEAFIHTAQAFGLTIAAGLIFGSVGGHLLAHTLRKNWVPHYLRNPYVLTVMLGFFAASDELAHESGLLTVTIMGMWLANKKDVDIDDILEFKETLSVLLISALFILLAARLDLNALLQVGTGVLVVLGVIIFIARPLGIFSSAIGSDLSLKEKLLLSWIAPRGIVAAAVSALFALKLEELGYHQASILVPMVFLVIITTVILQSFTAGFFAKYLGLRTQKPNGILIFGAGGFSRRFAKELMVQDIPVRLADTNWASISESRMDNIPVYYGNPTSDHAERNIDLTTFGRVLVISPYRQLNPVVTYHFENELGKGAVFGLDFNDQEGPKSHKVSKSYAAKLGLFGDSASYAKLNSLVAQGAQIKTTNISENFTHENYLERYEKGAIPLCAIDENNKVYIYTQENTFTPKAGWKIMSLVAKEVLEELKSQKEVDNTATPEKH
ncbi:cation:proton antiporter [Aurantivibrio plasticivorans]